MTETPEAPAPRCRIRCQLKRRHVTCMKVAGVAHVVYYGSEAVGLHILHTPAVWGVAITAIVVLLADAH